MTEQNVDKPLEPRELLEYIAKLELELTKLRRLVGKGGPGGDLGRFVPAKAFAPETLVIPAWRAEEFVGAITNESWRAKMPIPYTARSFDPYAAVIREEDAKELVLRFNVEMANAETRIAALEAERDAAFQMSRCECASDEACRNLVAKDARIAELEATLERRRILSDTARLDVIWQELVASRDTALRENDAKIAKLESELEQSQVRSNKTYERLVESDRERIAAIREMAKARGREKDAQSRLDTDRLIGMEYAAERREGIFAKVYDRSKELERVHEKDQKTIAALEARVGELEAKVKPGFSQSRDICDEYVATCNGCGHALGDEEEPHAWPDCIRKVREFESKDDLIEELEARIRELTQRRPMETAPRDGTRFVVVFNVEGRPFSAFAFFEEFPDGERRIVIEGVGGTRPRCSDTGELLGWFPSTEGTTNEDS